ncbi:MAG: ankyrin repeat domain-containing protein [Planctomycetia bacterium]|nr:ankyrin repeat domain-containing protein [Planctomycetia bacterium]
MRSDERGSSSRQQRLDKALIKAAGRGNVTYVRHLLDWGANADVVGELGLTPLAHAGRSHMSNAATVRLLLERGASIRPTEPARDPFLVSCHKSDEERIRLMLEYGPDVNAIDPTAADRTPLMELVNWASSETITLVLGYGADVNKRSTLAGVTTLHCAAFAGRLNIVRLLIERGADFFAADNRGWTAVDHVEDNLKLGAKAYRLHPEWAQPQRETLAWLKKEMAQRGHDRD